MLKQKRFAQWKPIEEVPLIYLGSDFFLLKFQKEENMIHALHDGPWFILNHFLYVRRWEPKFLASEAHLTYSAIWIQLPELPTEFYDIEILQKLGNKVGKLIKIDACTSAATRGPYAHICVEVPLDKPLNPTFILEIISKPSCTMDLICSVSTVVD